MKPLLDLEPNECRYALNDGGPFLFCAEAKQEGSSYCPEHHEICFRRVNEGSRNTVRPHFAALIAKARGNTITKSWGADAE